MAELLASPLHGRHVAAGARFAEFGGWDMPLQYSGIVAEHNAVRQGVGVFDVSHLGKASVSGPGAVDFVNRCLTNDLGRLSDGQAQYTLCCDASGGVVDDLIAYRMADDELFLIPNAANTAAVVARLAQAAPVGVEVRGRHRDFAIIAVQGPRSKATLEAMGLPADHGYMSFTVTELGGASVIVCRTGYTGEWGYELVVPAAAAERVWDAILAAGAAFGIVPAGLGARDTLRTEMGYPLHGHELSTATTPVQAQLNWAVGFTKEHFWGDEPLRRERADGPAVKLWGLTALGGGIPRPGMKVLDDGGEIGQVTSGTFSPTLGKGIALALLSSRVGAGALVQVQVRSRLEPFEVARPPFVPSHVR